VYWGAPNLDHFVPVNSVINAGDFETPRELAIYLTKLRLNSTIYDQYRAWRTGDMGEHFRRLERYVQKARPICSLLARIHEIWINPFLTKWVRNSSSDADSRALDCIRCLEPHTDSFFSVKYEKQSNRY
jgi:hypothetical protein